MDLLKSHRTIRKYKAVDIPEKVLTDILECGIRSSNTGNMQLYSIVVTRSIEKKMELAPFHFNQPMVVGAPVVLTICFDVNRFKVWCSINDAKVDFTGLLWLLNGAIDSSILAQNICVAAESYGLGICYLGTTLYNAPEISKVLHLPSGVIPITTLTIGYPEVIPELTDRLPLDSIVHFEEYQNYSDDGIKEMYSFKDNLDTSKKFVEENHKANLAQVYTDVRYKSADSQLFSRKLLKMLVDQGFVFE
jgi:nitroreductase